MGILIKKIIFFTLITFSIEANEIEEIIFSIKNDIYTTIDLNKRIEYLNTINKYYQNSDKYIDDYISIITFDIFAKEKKVVIDDKIINKYLSQLSNANKINENNKENIEANIKYDYQRMVILEKLISENIKKKIQKDGVDLIDIYEINIMYFVIDETFNEKIQELENNFKNKNIELIEKILIKNEIEYQYYDKKVVNIENIHPEIKKRINNNNNYFKFNDGYIVLGIINKELRKNLNLKYSLFQITSIQEEKLNLDKANCDNINSFNNNPNFNIKIYEKIESEKLNIKIRNELTNINDKVKIKNDNNESLIILCDIDFDYEIVKDRIFSEKIDHFAKQIEKDFVKEKITEYNFKKYE